MSRRKFEEATLLEVDALTVSYRLPSQRLFGFARALHAVDGVSLAIARGESLGLVGETGCGKSSLARAIHGLAPISGGAVRFDGVDLATAARAQRQAIRRGMQMIFQDPGGSLNPRMRIGALVAALRRDLGLALLFVSHDLDVVAHLCDRIAVMYLGRIVESGPSARVLASPGHPYTRDLVASSPVPDPDRPIRSAATAGDPPNPAAPPTGCRYHPRCRHATDICVSEHPGFTSIGADRYVACHHSVRVMSTQRDPP